jgi:hypothetical protein
MEKQKQKIFLTVLLLVVLFSAVYATEFRIILTITNKSNKYQKLFLKKGRILEIAKIGETDYQSIIITEGDGLIMIPPKTTIKRVIKGICLHKGLKFPVKNVKLQFTPFVGSDALIKAGSDQKEVHRITAFPRNSRRTVIGKGYSNSEKDGKNRDRQEAIQSAITDAARKAGISFESKALLENFRLLKDLKRIEIGKRNIFMKKTIHEEYDEKKVEYLFIGEFEVESEPPLPEVY